MNSKLTLSSWLLMGNSQTGQKNQKKARPICVIAIVKVDFVKGEAWGGCCSASTYLPIWKSFPRSEVLVESNAFPSTTEARHLNPASFSILASRTWTSKTNIWPSQDTECWLRDTKSTGGGVPQMTVVVFPDSWPFGDSWPPIFQAWSSLALIMWNTHTHIE